MTAWAGRRLLVVVAHPDDETFGLGSLLADAVSGGAHVTVCCATRGEAGEVGEGCEAPDGPLADAREQELHDAAALLGVHEVRLLAFADSGMDGDPADGTLVAVPLEDVVTAVLEVVRDVDPDAVVTLDPVAGDGHRDHVRIGEATTEAVRRAGAGASLYWWTVQRTALQRWLASLAEHRPDAGHLELDTGGLGRPDDEITTVLDVSAHVPLRRTAMAAHRTQRPPFDDMSPDVADAFLREDRLVRVVPPWPGGEPERALVLRDR